MTSNPMLKENVGMQEVVAVFVYEQSDLLGSLGYSQSPNRSSFKSGLPLYDVELAPRVSQEAHIKREGSRLAANPSLVLLPSHRHPVADFHHESSGDERASPVVRALDPLLHRLTNRRPRPERSIDNDTQLSKPYSLCSVGSSNRSTDVKVIGGDARHYVAAARENLGSGRLQDFAGVAWGARH
jgi:hypothetical protein